MRTRSRSHARSAQAILLAGVISLMCGPAAVSSPVAAAEEQDADSKLSVEVRSLLAADGSADFWVRFVDRADLSAARSITDWDERGAAVVQALRSTARTSQRDVRAYLTSVGAGYEPFWASNAIFVTAGTAQLANRLALYDEVSQIVPNEVFEPPELRSRGDGDAAPVEWGLRSIRAPKVWRKFDVRGEGVVVANIDTGVRYDHEALVNQYRGRKPNGGFNHDYDWLNNQNETPYPVDQYGHGTHTMGTMVGSDGGENRIGVAPAAKWIAANGCCDPRWLVASGEWMLAPTKLDGSHPKPGQRPHVINNSWNHTIGGPPMMEDVILAWEAAGIFGLWSNGNGGARCGTTAVPASQVGVYGVGAYDVDNKIAGFSSRGPGDDDEIRPSISAPGVDVRSSWHTGGYVLQSGTSMAAPHVAGAVALLWSAVPQLVGDIETTRDLLDDTAVDVSDLTCGGTADDNNVWGEGRLDAFALVKAGRLAVG